MIRANFKSKPHVFITNRRAFRIYVATLSQTLLQSSCHWLSEFNDYSITTLCLNVLSRQLTSVLLKLLDEMSYTYLDIIRLQTSVSANKTTLSCSGKTRSFIQQFIHVTSATHLCVFDRSHTVL